MTLPLSISVTYTNGSAGSSSVSWPPSCGVADGAPLAGRSPSPWVTHRLPHRPSPWRSDCLGLSPLTPNHSVPWPCLIYCNTLLMYIMATIMPDRGLGAREGVLQLGPYHQPVQYYEVSKQFQGSHHRASVVSSERSWSFTSARCPENAKCVRRHHERTV